MEEFCEDSKPCKQGTQSMLPGTEQGLPFYLVIIPLEFLITVVQDQIQSGCQSYLSFPPPSPRSLWCI